MNILIPISITTLILIANKSKSTSKIEKVSNTNTLVTVGLYKSYGVSEISFEAAKDLLKSTKNIKLKIEIN